MTTPLKLLGIALAVVLVATGLVAAGYGPGAHAADGERTTTGAGDGPVADADRPLDGSNILWMTGDERLERFQERFGLTDSQVEQIRTQVTAMIQDGADRDAIRAQVQTMLQNFGVEDPTLGPMAGQGLGEGQRYGDGPHAGDGPRAGSGTQAGHGPWAGAGQHGAGQHGGGHQGSWGSGPHGPADGSCMG